MRDILVSNRPMNLEYRDNKGITGFVSKKLTSIIHEGKFCPISVELCPGRALNGEDLRNLSPRFCAVTWFGQDISDTHEIPALTLAEELHGQGYDVLLHLTGRNLRRTSALNFLEKARGVGVRNILALQGDPSQIIEEDDKKCDFAYAADLVRFIREHFGDYFCIAVAGYPENHPKSRSTNQEMEFLRQKILSGADVIVTQASFKYEAFEQFYIRCKEYSIDVPIIPGLLIINSYQTLIGISKFCSISIPDDIYNIVYSNQNNSEAIQEYGIYLAMGIMKRILKLNSLFAGVHIFTLNNLSVVIKVLEHLGMYGGRIERPLENIDKQ